MKPIPLYSPKIGNVEKRNVTNCLNEKWISSKGKFIKLFENEFKKFTNIRHCTTTVNGTAALHLCLLALDIKENDEIIVPTFTYIASVNCIKYVGGKPVFVDSDFSTMQISINDIEKKISKKTKAIIVPHLYGYSCDLSKLLKLKKKYNVYLVEDCAEALGSFYKKKHLGNFGDICAFSFFGSKTISTGEGGMVCSNNKFLIRKVIKFKGQGLNITNKKKYYWHNVIGYNYRMTNICASIGYAQIKRISKILKKKKFIFNFYKKNLNSKYVKFPSEVIGLNNCYWLVVIFFQSKKINQIINKILYKNKIETRPTFYPIHTMPMYKKKNNFKNATQLNNLGLCLPSYPDLENKQLKKICKIINDYFKKLKKEK